MSRKPVFASRDVGVARMRLVGLRNRADADPLVLAQAQYDYGLVRLGRAAQDLAAALDWVGEAKADLTAARARANSISENRTQ